jgi:hypothetical protein
MTTSAVLKPIPFSAFHGRKRLEPHWIALLRVCELFLTAVIASSILNAGVIPVNSRSVLAGTDFVDWGQLPHVCCAVSLPTPVTVLSQSGLSIQITGSFVSWDQQMPPGPWNGNFAAGDNLLFGGPTLTLTFERPIFGLGAQVGLDFGPTPFTATMSLYDPLGFLITTISVAAFEDTTHDNSAVFLGALSNIPIKSVILDAVPDPNGGFAINRLDLVTAPEPESRVIFGLVAACILLVGCRSTGKP